MICLVPFLPFFLPGKNPEGKIPMKMEPGALSNVFLSFFPLPFFLVFHFKSVPFRSQCFLHYVSKSIIDNLSTFFSVLSDTLQVNRTHLDLLF